jgi:hypothetical protein
MTEGRQRRAGVPCAAVGRPVDPGEWSTVTTRQEPFAIEASVTYSGAWGDRNVRYWHQTPHYWRAEQDGRIILMSCDDGWVSHDEAL